MNTAKEGASCKVTTIKGETFEAIYYAFDPKTNVLVLYTPTDKPILPHQNPRYNFTIISAGSVKEFKVISPPTSSSTVINVKPVSSLNMEKVAIRERSALRAMEKQLASIGIGVSEEAQEIFNALSKTYPCSWKGKNIVVMDEVVITPPYRPEDCEGPVGGAIDRLRIVLNAERHKIGVK